MLREIKNGKFYEQSGGCLLFWQTCYNFRAGKLRFPQNSVWFKKEYQKIIAQQLNEPVRLGEQNERTYWTFQNKFYWDDDNLSSIEVKALALDREYKKKRKIQRAISRMEQVQTQSSSNLSQRLGNLPRETIPNEVKMYVWQRDQGRCAKCGSNQYLEFDHIIPLSLGGSNTARNLQLLCEKCNREKGGNLV